MTNAELIATLRGENYFVTLLHDPNISHHRRRDLKRYLGRLHKELSEAKKWSKAV